MHNSLQSSLKYDDINDGNILSLRKEVDDAPRDEEISVFEEAFYAEQYNHHSWPWPHQPLEINEPQVKIPALASDMIPERLRAWVTDISERLQMPTDTVLAPALVAFSCAVGNRISIKPKRHDDWSVVPNLCGGLVGSSGFLKSAAMDEVFAPLRNLAGVKVDRIFGEANRIVNKARKSALTEMIKTATKKGDAVTIDQIKNHIENLIRDVDRDDRIRHPKIITPTTNNRTSISEMIRDNPGGLLIIKGHLDNWLRRLSKRRHEDDLEFVLGSGDVRALNSPGVRGPLGVFGEIAAGDLRKYLVNARRKWRDKKVLRRFHLLIYHNEKIDLPAVDRRPNYLARENVCDLFKMISDVPLPNSENIPAVRFSDQAQEIFDQWSYELKLRVKNAENENALFAEHVEKYYALMPSLALLFSLLEKPENIQGWNSVSAAATDLAVKWCSFLEEHARKIYSIDREAKRTAVKKIVQSLKNGLHGEGATIKSICRRPDTAQTAPELIRGAIDTLEDQGWLRIVRSDGEKRIALHPKLQSNVRMMRRNDMPGFVKMQQTH